MSMRMTEQEARDVVKACGWSYLLRIRKGHFYMYAARYIGGKRKEKYIAPLARLEHMTEETIVEKLRISAQPTED